MYKNYKLLLFLGAAIIFLYISVGKYEEFSIEKSISACTIAKSKLQPHDTGHIHTSISYLESRVEEVQKEIEERLMKVAY